MSIDEIYRLVQTFANKEQRGFITPSDFNLLAKQAELELINKRIEVLQEKSQVKKISGIMEESLTPEVAESIAQEKSEELSEEIEEKQTSEPMVARGGLMGGV